MDCMGVDKNPSMKVTLPPSPPPQGIDSYTKSGLTKTMGANHHFDFWKQRSYAKICRLFITIIIIIIIIIIFILFFVEFSPSFRLNKAMFPFAQNDNDDNWVKTFVQTRRPEKLADLTLGESVFFPVGNLEPVEKTLWICPWYTD